MKERKGVTKQSLEYETIQDYLNKNTDLLEKYVRDNVNQTMLEKWLNEKRGKNNRNLAWADKSLIFDLKETEEPDPIGWFRNQSTTEMLFIGIFPGKFLHKFCDVHNANEKNTLALWYPKPTSFDDEM